MHGQRLFAWTLPLEFQTRPVSIYLVTLSMVTYYYSGKALEIVMNPRYPGYPNTRVFLPHFDPRYPEVNTRVVWVVDY